MIKLRIGDVSVPCASAEIAATIVQELRVHVFCDTEEELEVVRNAFAYVFPPPFIVGPVSSQS